MSQNTLKRPAKGQQIANHTIFTGDNLDIMRGMDSESIDLIYLDPPFNSNRHYAAPIGSKAAGAEFKDAWTFEDTKDAWWGLIADEHPALYKVIDAAGDVGNEGDKAYLIYMAMRLLEMHRILKPTGSIYLHCDPTMSHSLKMTMDAVFGKESYQNEIIWNYRRWPAKQQRFQRMHDTIYFYRRDDSKQNAVWNQLFEPLAASTQKTFGEKKQVADFSSGKRKPSVKNEKTKGAPMRDVWDIGVIAPVAKERTGYPTQKPLALLKRIIEASSNEGDVVLDPFCGCATACLAAEDLHRQWIGIDISPLAATLIAERMDNELGMFSEVFHRKDIPMRTEDAPPPSRDINHTLFGKQEGKCNGCGHSFPFQNFTRDHIVPSKRGGPDTDKNLQLLCGRCNSVKGDRTMEYLIARLKEDGIIGDTGVKGR